MGLMWQANRTGKPSAAVDSLCCQRGTVLQFAGDKLDRAGLGLFAATSGQQALEVNARRGLPRLAIDSTTMSEPLNC